MATTNNPPFEVYGNIPNTLFKLKVYRGEGMALLAMDWKEGKPSDDFVGFSIEYKEPGGKKFYAIPNRLSFLDSNGKVKKGSTTSLLAPFQKFRWIHFPYNPDIPGDFTYMVKPVFMNDMDELSYGEAQTASIQLMHETYHDKLNVSFTRGFVLSQAFVDRYEKDGGIPALIPSEADQGLRFQPTHPRKDEALTWMGFEARAKILELLDKAYEDDKAEVRVVAYDLNEPELVNRLVKLKERLKIIIDNSDAHGELNSAEAQTESLLEKSTAGQVKRHHMGKLQHNKTIVVSGPKIKAAICGSTNFSWRGFYVQANNAVILYGANAIKPFNEAFDNYWKYDSVKDFGKTNSAGWTALSLPQIDAKVSFSPHATNNALLKTIADDIESKVTSCVFYSLAFLFQTPGVIKNAIEKITADDNIFIYGISDRKVGGLDLQKPGGNIAPVYPSEMSKNLPEPFKSEPSGGKGCRMHHKFVVIDFNKPNARVYFGSYNFSSAADITNGENLLLIKDRRIAVSYMIEALRIFDHYHFRVTQKEATKAKKLLALSKPPRNQGEEAWWKEYYKVKVKILDREIFSQ
ncbi:MAG: phospholipase [Candidatus Atribacteria bacterium]|nr:phospholipase [Candidatus Atribacteria bacterium]